MRGALLMATSTIRSGAGLVTVCAPESVYYTAMTQYPEAMWIPAPESTNGTFAKQNRIFEHASRATSILIGPGIGNAEESGSHRKQVLESEGVPLILDADALQPRQIELLQNTSNTSSAQSHRMPANFSQFRAPPSRSCQAYWRHSRGKGPRTWSSARINPHSSYGNQCSRAKAAVTFWPA